MPIRTTTLADYQQRILRAQQYLEARLDDPLDPAALAAAAQFSLHHFHRIFRALLGESVMQHVRRLRLERAARRLRQGNSALIELAVEARYESHEAFTRAFAAHFGCPPSAYRDHPPSAVTGGLARPPDLPLVTVEVRTSPAVPVVAMRHRGSYAQVGETWSRMLQWLAARGRLGAPLYGLCPDDPEVTEAAHLRFDACAALPPGGAALDGLAAAEIPAGTYAVGLHRGPYDRLHETYLDVIGRWFPSSGYALSPDPVVEHYLNDPACTPAQDLLTEVRVRIADR